jgi:D-methionine transport system ATP-binding protein
MGFPVHAPFERARASKGAFVLELKDIVVRFHGHGHDVSAVQGVSLKVKAGEVYGIIGTSGAGKSTLLRTINLLQRPDSGQVWVRGGEITRLEGEPLRQLRLKIGMVFQHFELVGSRNIFENIALPLRAAKVPEPGIRKRVAELLDLVELKDKERALPGQLSGGQKQRVGIARALANHPDLLLCDEPTSALDLETTESILDLLGDINRRLGLTVVVISHEMAVIKRICHRVAVMKDGKVVEENDVYGLFSSPQHPLSQELVEKSLGLALPQRVLDKVQGAIARLVHLGDEAEEPVLAEAVKETGVHLNILHGRIEYVGGRPIGILVVALTGGRRKIQDGLAYLQSRVARVEVIRHG